MTRKGESISCTIIKPQNGMKIEIYPKHYSYWLWDTNEWEGQMLNYIWIIIKEKELCYVTCPHNKLLNFYVKNTRWKRGWFASMITQ